MALKCSSAQVLERPWGVPGGVTGCDGAYPRSRGVTGYPGCDRAYPGEVGDVMEHTQGGMDLTQGCEGPSSSSPTVSSRHP